MRITLNQIKRNSPCQSGWGTLLKSLNKKRADNTEVSIAHLLNSNGIDDTLWVINNCIENDLDKKRNICADFAESAIEHAERVLHIFEKERPNDNRPRKAIEKAKKVVRLMRVNAINVTAAKKAVSVWVSSAVTAADSTGADTRAAYAAYAAAASVYSAASKDFSLIVYAARVSAEDARKATGEVEDIGKKMEIEKQKRIILKYFG